MQLGIFDVLITTLLDLFRSPNPNPTLRLYLDLLEAAGARMDTANGNTVGHVISRIGELRLTKEDVA